MERRFETPQPVDLHVGVNDGRVEVHAQDARATTITITGARAAEFTVVQDGRRIEVSAPDHRSWRLGRHHVTVVLPVGSDATVSAGSASVSTTGPLTQLTISCGSGEVVAEQATNLSVSAGSGDVTARSAASAYVKCGSGRIRLDLIEEIVRASSGSGSISIGRVTGEVSAKSGSGGLRIGDLDGSVRFDTGSGNVTIERLRRGRVRVRAGSGSVRIGVDAGLRVWTDIASVSGEVVSRLPHLGAPEPGEDHAELRIRTLSGSVHLNPVDRGPQDAPVGAAPQDAPRGPDHASAYADPPQDAPAHVETSSPG